MTCDLANLAVTSPLWFGEVERKEEIDTAGAPRRRGFFLKGGGEVSGAFGNGEFAPRFIHLPRRYLAERQDGQWVGGIVKVKAPGREIPVSNIHVFFLPPKASVFLTRLFLSHHFFDHGSFADANESQTSADHTTHGPGWRRDASQADRLSAGRR